MSPLPISAISPTAKAMPCGAHIADARALLSLGQSLRMPVASVSGTLNQLAAGALGALPDAVLPLLNSARYLGAYLTDLADDILLLGEFGSGRISFRMQSVDLAPLMATTIATQTEREHARGIRFRFTTDLTEARVYADPRWLASAIARPLALAARATAQGGAVPISLDMRGTFYRLTYPDPIGAAPAANQISANLGLGIAEAILERHGGSLLRGAHPTYGMAVRIDLPEWTPAQERGKPGYKRAISLTNMSTSTGFCK